MSTRKIDKQNRKAGILLKYIRMTRNRNNVINGLKECAKKSFCP